MFASLRYRDYRLYWTGGVISFTGSWVQTVCHGWLVYDITDSKLWLGFIGFIGALPLSGLTLFGGAIADRVDKKRALVVTQALFAVCALALGVLVGTGTVNRYHILAIAFLQGIFTSFDAPLRHSMPAYLVPKKHLMNAIVLNSAAFNSARVIGPAVAGILVAHTSMAVCFYVNAVSYLAVIGALLLMKTAAPAGENPGASVLADIADGLRYIRSERRICRLMIGISISSLFVMPYMTLIPIFARDILSVGIRGNASLLTSIGIGAVAGALVLARLSSMPRRARILVAASAIGAVLLMTFANSRSFLLSRFVLVGLGFTVVSFNQTTNTLIQSLADDAFRGRVMSAYVFLFLGLSPIANLQVGVLAEAIGAPAALTICGSVFLITAAFFAAQSEVMKL